MVPTTLEETIVCYADKFFSKTGGGCERGADEVVNLLERYGPEKAALFKQWHIRFSGQQEVGPQPFNAGGRAAQGVTHDHHAVER